MYKIEIYSFALTATFILGRPSDFIMEGWPAETINIRRVRGNWPYPNCCLIDSFKVGSVNGIVMPIDASMFSVFPRVRQGRVRRFVEYVKRVLGFAKPYPEAEPFTIELPVMTAGQPVIVRGRYNGEVPKGLAARDHFAFMLQMTGYSTVRSGDDDIRGLADRWIADRGLV
jgi:hypothetical protein